MPSIEIVPVRRRRERQEFLYYPWKQYRHDPYWIPPLRYYQREMVGYSRHPFYDAAESQTFIARRSGETVGRIAAIVNHAYNRLYTSDPLGFVGFFDAIDDQDVANALFQAARDWLAERKLEVIRGPANPSMTYESGLLIEGFDSTPTFMMTYNPPYYARLWENFGFRKAHDLLGYIGHMSQIHELEFEGKLANIAQQCVERYGVAIRRMDPKQYHKDVEIFLKLYNNSMILTWGFVPISQREMRHLATSLKHLIHMELAFMAEVDGKPAGAVLCLPDYNPRIKEIDGRLFPFGFLRLLSSRKDIKRVRVMAINVLPEFQRVGVGLVLLRALVPAVRELQIEEAEFSWVLESNDLPRLGLEKGGAKIYKRWRMYDYRPGEKSASAQG